MADLHAHKSHTYALLIGIDDYPQEPLRGCVNDTDRMAHWLMSNARVPGANIVRLTASRPRASRETRPTRTEVLAALDDLDSDRISSQDQILIYYAGHGRRDTILMNGKSFASEALVTCDEGATNAIHDWEFNNRLAKIAQRTLNVTVILDCCHAAGAFRGVPYSNGVRRLPGKTIDVADLPCVPGASWMRGMGPIGRPSLRDLVVLAACHEDELAHESQVSSGKIHGVFSTALLDALQPFDYIALRKLSWHRLWPDILAGMTGQWQNPWPIGDLGHVVLGGYRADRSIGLPIKQEGSSIVIGAGTLLDVTDGAQIAVYGPTPPRFEPIGSARDIEARAGILVVTKAERHRSFATYASTPFDLPDEARGRVVEAGKQGRVRVHVDPRLLEHAGPLLERTTVYETVIDPGEADARLALTPDDTALALYDDMVDGIPRDTGTREYVGARIPLETPDLHACTQRLVEHYATYVRPIRLGRRAIDLSGALKITVLDCNDDMMLSSSDPQRPDLSPINEIDGIPTVRLGDRYCFHIENESPVVLKVALLECGINGVVIYHGDTVINAGSFHVFWRGEVLGCPIPAGPPPGLSRIVAIGTTDRTATFRHLECKTTFTDSVKSRLINTDSRLSNTDHPTAPRDRWTGIVAYLDTIISHDLTKGATR